MSKYTVAGYSFSLKGLLVVIWMIVITSLSLINLGIVAESNQTAKFNDYDNQFQQLYAQLAVYSEQLDDKQQQPNVSQADLTDVRQELMQRIQAVVEQQATFALKQDLQALQEKLNANQQRISKIENDIADLSIQINTLKQTKQAPNKTIKTGKVVYSPPFKVLGAELRGGERMLLVIPHGKSSIDDVQLIAKGQRYGNWQLQSYNSQSAVFKVGSSTRRIAFAK